MQCLVSDTSCLIDLRRASLVEAFLGLPYEILLPNTLFEAGLVRFSPAEKEIIVRGGLTVVDLPAKGVLRAQAIVRERPHLSIHDGFVLALAESREECGFVSSDRGLRTLAVASGMEAHGVLWVIDEIRENGLVSAEDLLIVLHAFDDDPTARFPHRKLAVRTAP